MSSYFEQIVKEIQNVLSFLEETERLTLTEISEKSGVNYSQLSRFKNETHLPAQGTAIKALSSLERAFEGALSNMPRPQLSTEIEKLAKRLQIRSTGSLLTDAVLEQVLKELQANRKERKELKIQIQKLLAERAAGNPPGAGDGEGARDSRA